MILIGGWCLYLYRIHYKDPPEITALRTSDIDLLIPRKIQLANNCDLTSILKELGFEIIYGPEGHIKFTREDFDVEFLTPETGAGSAKPYEFKQLNLNAQQLRYLTILQDNVMTIKYRGISVIVPNVQSFIVHKILIMDKRKPDKRLKDMETVMALLDFILTKPKLFDDFKVYYSKLLRPWQKRLRANAKRYLPGLSKMLSVI